MFIADVLSNFAARLDYDEIPAPVISRAKHLMLDAIGVAFASGKYEFARAALNGIRPLGTGDSDVIGFADRLALRDAVLLNGILVHGLDYDDTYLPGSMHLTASNVPTAIGVAAHTRAGGRDLLAACIVGLEVAARLAGAAKGGFQRTGFHATGVCAAFSCALVSGRLLGLTSTQLTMAQGIALSTASGSMQPLRDGSWTKRMHPGWAGGAGITAASMAKGGYIGPQAAYEGHFGFYPMYLGNEAPNAELGLVTNGLGEVWELQRTSVKLFPAGHLSHAFMKATIGLVRDHHITPEAVESVQVLVGKGAIPLICEPVEIKRRPTTSYMAQFSLQYGIACCIARGAFGLTEIEASSFNDSALIGLAQKVGYEVDPDAGFPKYRTGEVIIRMKDGREFRRRETIHPDEPAEDKDIVAKFMDNARAVMPEARATAICSSVFHLEEQNDMQDFSGSLAHV